ncbi:hypothetical protein ABIC28_005225 [Rhodococcus sp. PvR044]|jgi:hypothetical protein|uniref:DUF3224 domain-containing protein n=1 Tax=Rhodococcus TaxID=1827 RepID=UPI000BCCF5B4|nr:MULTISPECIES: DUF3224 domain-containing protein [Rhodococcus]MBP1159450.1 hypothetical protein [Rhodococcus sp. PvR099]MCZ4556710.1 DUF3224 domain-containing protein [Rhodococcus maanshanensis]PTR43450.1 uncharacterized protein DUF3224 [Rhodococcus sp. OK611]SNX90795.1 Protein of unknown function [Rhodococcus sp. OK270]
MQADSTFSVTSFEPTEYTSPIQTGLDVGYTYMTKTFTGDIEGTSRTQFTSAFSQETGVGTYLAMESFEGSIGDRRGTFNFAHMATTDGADRSHHQLVVVPTSGTGDLAGITGTGELLVDADGTHRLRLDVEFAGN